MECATNLLEVLGELHPTPFELAVVEGRLPLLGEGDAVLVLPFQPCLTRKTVFDQGFGYLGIHDHGEHRFAHRLIGQTESHDQNSLRHTKKARQAHRENGAGNGPALRRLSCAWNLETSFHRRWSLYRCPSADTSST